MKGERYMKDARMGTGKMSQPMAQGVIETESTAPVRKPDPACARSVRSKSMRSDRTRMLALLRKHASIRA